MGEMTLADIAAVTDRDNNAFGGNNGGMWIFALLILLMMGGGYWNKGNQDGVAIPGMTASQTVKAAGDIVTLGVSGIIRTYCTKPVSTLTIVVSGMAATGTNLAIDITKQ